MHIINAMFGKGLGGIEQCLIDYTEALLMENHRVTCVVATGAAITQHLKRFGDKIHIIELRQHGAWDMLAKRRLKKQLASIKADVAIAHGNRALKLLSHLPDLPLVGVTHNYKLKHINRADAVLALTDDLAAASIKHGVKTENIYPISNMIRLPQLHHTASNTLNTPPAIATMGRFVKKKGMDVFIRALALLRDEKIEFKAFIAGDGEEKPALHALASELNLTPNHLEFTGWVSNKSDFIQQADIFCVPSHHEPFGIIVLEALAHGIPTISTKSEGPSEILSNGENALLTEIGDANAMANAIKKLLLDQSLRKKFTKNGLSLIEDHYIIEVVAAKLSHALEAIKNQYAAHKTNSSS